MDLLFHLLTDDLVPWLNDIVFIKLRSSAQTPHTQALHQLRRTMTAIACPLEEPLLLCLLRHEISQ